MFNKTGNQLKKVGKEVISIFTSLRDDISQEIKISKQVKAYRKSLYSTAKEQEQQANAHTRENPKT